MQDVLLIIDLQNGVCQTNDQTIDHLSELLLFVNQRIQRYRKEEKPVILLKKKIAPKMFVKPKKSFD